MQLLFLINIFAYFSCFVCIRLDIFPVFAYNIDKNRSFRQKLCHRRAVSDTAPTERMGIMTFDEMFAQAKALLENASAKDTDTTVSVQFDVSGDGCGAFYAVVSADSDELTIEPFD